MIGIRTGELTQLVVDKYGGDRGAENLAKYIPLTQVGASTGGSNNIADVLVLGAWKSSGNLLDGFEVKISRADWLNEVKNPEKCMAIKKYCDRWWLVISDASMVKEGELPEDWGMMVVEEGLMGEPRLKVIKKAPLLASEPMSHDFVASLLRTDARGQIAMDVHNDQMKDLQRKFESDYKEKYETLNEFVKYLAKDLGIELNYSEYSTSGKHWYARVNNWRFTKEHFGGNINLTPQQLAAAIKIVLTGKLSDIKYRLRDAAEASKQVLKITDEFPDDE